MKRMYSLLILFCFVSGISQVYCQQNSSVIRGRIIESNGNPLAGTSITIENTFLGVSSDNDGHYSFKSLKDGTYSLKFSFIGFESQVKIVNLSGIADVDVTLRPVPFLTDEVLVNATRAGENAPLAYSVIDREIIKKQNTGQDLPYLLSLTPSLVETSEAGNGVGYTSLRIRGTDANRINVTVDGIPLNDPESQQVFWVDLPDLASSVENIQIQRGVGTSSNGAGAFGATISIQTLNPENEASADASTSIGSFNTIKNMLSAGTGLLGGKFAFNMRYSDLRSNGYIDRTGSKHRSAFMSAVYRTEKTRLKANIILGEEHTGIGWWGVPKDSLSTNRKYNPAGEYTDENGSLQYYSNESDNYNQNHFQLLLSHKAGEYLSLNAALHYTMGKGYYEEYRQDQELSEYGLNAFSIGSQSISSTDLIRRKWLDNDFYGLIYSAKYKKDRTEIIAGGGLNQYLGDHFGNLIWMKTAGNTEKDYRWYLNNSIKNEFSIYGKIKYMLSENLTAFGDLQYRHISYSMKGPDDDLKDLNQKHNFDFFNPKAGLFYSLTPNQDAYLSFSVANREPSRSDFKEASGDVNSTPKPETLFDTELGYKLRREKGSFTANIYGMFYKDQLVPTGELSDVGYPIMTNVEKSYRTGIELSAAVKLSKHLDWNINYTLSRNKITNFKEYYTDYDTVTLYRNRNLGLVDIAYSPSGIIASDMIFKFNKVSLHLISKYIGKQYLDNTMNPGRAIDPYFVNNIRVDVNPKIRNLQGLELQLLINNFLNEAYESNAYGGTWSEFGVEKSWSYYFPQAGINYMFRVSLKF